MIWFTANSPSVCKIFVAISSSSRFRSSNGVSELAKNLFYKQQILHCVQNIKNVISIFIDSFFLFSEYPYLVGKSELIGISPLSIFLPCPVNHK